MCVASRCGLVERIKRETVVNVEKKIWVLRTVRDLRLVVVNPGFVQLLIT